MIALTATAPDATTPGAGLAPAGATLYQWEFSPYCYKVRMAAGYKGLRFDEQLFSLPERKASLEHTGKAKVPVIEAPDGWVTDSTAILHWLDERFAERPLFPTARRADVELLEDWGDETLAAAVETWIWVGGERMRPLQREFRKQIESLPVLLYVRLVEPKYRRMWFRRAEAFGGLEGTRKRSLALLRLLERRLGDDEWLFGRAPTAADFAVTAHLLNLVRFCDGELLDEVPAVDALVRRAGAFLPEQPSWLS